MFRYYLGLGLHSLRRNPVLTALMIVLIGAGVASSMITFAALRALTADPLPQKSAQLFGPQIDNWGPANRGTDDEPPQELSYTDALALLNAHKALRQTAIYETVLSLVPADARRAPFTVKGYAATRDMFAMFDVPFTDGGSWSAVDDAKGGSSVVISWKLSEKLFGGTRSLGRRVSLGGRDYRVVGVMGDWNPQPRFYAEGSIKIVSDVGDPPDFFVPFATAINFQLIDSWGENCTNDYKGAGWNDLLRSQCDWISFWVQLPTAADVQRYKAFLDGYAAEQQRIGRFPWAPNNRLRSLMQWLNYLHVVTEETRVAFLLAIGLQLVCLVNTVGLLLAKFMRRRGEIGVRRALGASRGAIHAQFLIEAGMVGAAGGLLGLALTACGVFGMGSFFEARVAQLVHIDMSLLGLTLLTSIVATLIAALYPAWRAAHVQPAWQLKSN
jgi:putative ABC transport system permease protein